MSNENLSEKDKIILQGRIYPAIQSCVNNRYKIILAIFAYYSFIFSSENFFEKSQNSNINLFASIIFTFFVGHNLVNYWSNQKEQMKIETKAKNKCKCPLVEIAFSIVTLLLIWLAYSYL